MKELVEFLRSIKDIVKIAKLEEKIGCPNDTLQKAVQGSKPLPKKWIQPLKKYFRKLSQDFEKFSY